MFLALCHRFALQCREKCGCFLEHNTGKFVKTRIFIFILWKSPDTQGLKATSRCGLQFLSEAVATYTWGWYRVTPFIVHMDVGLGICQNVWLFKRIASLWKWWWYVSPRLFLHGIRNNAILDRTWNKSTSILTHVFINIFIVIESCFKNIFYFYF